jgi:predicted MFS family arabinose efflux permease
MPTPIDLCPPCASENPRVSADRLPISALLALAMASFITILTEVSPAGLLPQIGRRLSIFEAIPRQLVTIYSIGSLGAAIPLTAAKQDVRRKPLLLIAIFGFALATAFTTMSAGFTLTVVARFAAGVSADMAVWKLRRLSRN